jgi:hypothetical protein
LSGLGEQRRARNAEDALALREDPHRQYSKTPFEFLSLEIDWQGTTYASLSAIARAITGTAWSGPRFFALAPRNGTSARGNNKRSARGDRNGSQPARGSNKASLPLETVSPA